MTGARPGRQTVDEDEAALVGDKDTVKRTLYECSHARVGGNRIYCGKGHVFSLKSNNSGLDAKRLARGDPLVLAVCQDCSDFDSMGPPIPDEERGWIRKRVMRVAHRVSSEGGRKHCADGLKKSMRGFGGRSAEGPGLR